MKNPHQKGILTDFLDKLSIPRADWSYHRHYGRARRTIENASTVTAGAMIEFSKYVSISTSSPTSH